MARIAFFLEDLPPSDDAIARFSWELIRGLADQQHEIHVFSTYRANADLPDKHPRIEILRPFRDWGVMEIPKALPPLLSFRPEVLHVIQPHGRAIRGWSNAMALIPGLAPLLGGARTVVSFFDITERTLRRHRLLLAGADALTVSNERQRETVERFYDRRPPPPLEVVPIPLSRQPETVALEFVLDAAAPSADLLERLREKYPETLLVPGPVDQHLDPVDTFRAVAEVLRDRPRSCAAITGGWGSVPVRVRHAAEEMFFDAGVGDRVVLTGPLTIAEQNDWIRRSECVLISTLNESRMAFTQHLREAQALGAAIVMSTEQAGLDPIEWRDGENAWVRPRSTDSIRAAVSECLGDPSAREKVRRNNAEFSKSSVIDHPGNAISRLYVRALTR